jgi:hypothetical protein
MNRVLESDDRMISPSEEETTQNRPPGTQSISRDTTVLSPSFGAGYSPTDARLDYTEKSLDNQLDQEVFWKTMGKDIEEILKEVDRMIALADEKGQTSIAQYWSSIFRQPSVTDHTKTPTVAIVGSLCEPTEGVVLRKPRYEDEYWSISATAWLHTTNTRRTILSNVGRINETSEGEEAPYGDCRACSRSGAECMVYREGFCDQGGDKAGQACSRCRFRGLKCSFDTRKTNGNSKRKGGTRGVDRCEQMRKTRTLRKLRSSGIAQ